jgi:hypothetical protein
VGGAAEKPVEMAEHLEKLVGGAIRRTSCGDLVEKSCSAGNGAAKRHGGAVAIWWEVGGMRWSIWGRMLVSPTGMARGVFGSSRRPRALGFDRMRRIKN